MKRGYDETMLYATGSNIRRYSLQESTGIIFDNHTREFFANTYGFPEFLSIPQAMGVSARMYLNNINQEFLSYDHEIYNYLYNELQEVIEMKTIRGNEFKLQVRYKIT